MTPLVSELRPPSPAPHLVSSEMWTRIEDTLGVTGRPGPALVLPTADPNQRVLVILVEGRVLPCDAELRERFGLTSRESEVARLIADRLSTAEIARRLSVSIHTVRRHSERVLAKLGVRSRNDVRSRLSEDSLSRNQALARRIA